ncbi:hypothetical protein GUITHDRAFT_154094 [Guillardia theta CCMP2712]|uniref:Uncharacterized protein n=1 Tax=Guillardia theta (strain CCMP2712) TaxID=905079 RepID=L1IWE2_GUITC|nr:hypothetical protein GUITHDRAFT_154094 [Guillardia theta CCMP2712]EKX40556.1 hypothetical protein GUITHDRAFT_154094 [Guillardia theta CCMP2712]|eukprot:XP_005827536.1 hypothetical protein GUITHDRAFT_154094 [Guillardia theta CCMP2712]
MADEGSSESEVDIELWEAEDEKDQSVDEKDPPTSKEEMSASSSNSAPLDPEEVDKMLDSNYSMILQLVRLRYGSIGCNPPPSSLMNPRLAQATRSLVRQSADSERK